MVTWDTASRLYPVEMFMQPAQANRLHVYSTLYVSVSFYEKNNLAMLLLNPVINCSMLHTVCTGKPLTHLNRLFLLPLWRIKFKNCL